MRRLVHLGGRSEEIDALRPELRAAGVEESWEALRSLGESVRKQLLGLVCETGPHGRALLELLHRNDAEGFFPRHAEAILSGGRYDTSFLNGGSVRGACGFAVYLSLMIEES